jgi:CheY-like chemotaxis protein
MTPHINSDLDLQPPVGLADQQPLRILLVEDSPSVRDVLIDELDKIPGIALTGIADTEKAALEILRAEEFDVLILDIELRQGTGTNLLRSMSTLELAAATVKIVFTNHVGKEFREAGRRSGAQYFFDKASEFNRLRELLIELAAERQ